MQRVLNLGILGLYGLLASGFGGMALADIPPDPPRATESGVNWPLMGGLGVAVALAIGAVAVFRSRRKP